MRSFSFLSNVETLRTRGALAAPFMRLCFYYSLTGSRFITVTENDRPVCETAGRWRRRPCCCCCCCYGSELLMKRSADSGLIDFPLFAWLWRTDRRRVRVLQCREGALRLAFRRLMMPTCAPATPRLFTSQHRRRLRGGDDPHGQKVVGAMPLSRPHRNFVMSPLYAAKVYSKITNVSLWNVKKVRWLQRENAPKAFGGRAPPEPAGWALYAI